MSSAFAAIAFLTAYINPSVFPAFFNTMSVLVENAKYQGLKFIKKFTSKEGLIGDYDYLYLFTPNIPFLTKKEKIQPFFAIDLDMPVCLGFLLGLQHALAMLAGIVTPPLLIASAANLDTELTQFLVSCCMISSLILLCIQITRFHIYKTPYYIGTGLLCVVGTSFTTISIVSKAFPIMYKDGTCPIASDGTKLPCPDGYGFILGTTCCCALLEILCSFLPPKVLQKIFPPIVTGPVVLLIGISLVTSGFEDLVGGSGCIGEICPSEGAPMALTWGSAQFIGLGFLVYITIIILEKWGAPIMKSMAVIMGLLVGCIVAAACGYFDRSGIDIAPSATFLWVHTFKLRVYGPIVLPLLALFIVLMMEAIGDITATLDVSRLPVEGEEYESRIQGGILADGLSGILSPLFMTTPMLTFAQNNGVISITKCASRTVGYWCCFFLLIMGIFSKFAAAIVAIPKPVIGGVTTFLFTSVAVSGLAIIAGLEFTRRDRFVLTASLMWGFGATMVPTWFSTFFGYKGDNKGLSGLLNAIDLVMETGFAVTGFVAVILNVLIPQEPDEDDSEELVSVRSTHSRHIDGTEAMPENEDVDEEKIKEK